MVSMKDIANRAGVSIATVSYALNGSKKVTEATARKILELAEEMNYVPNAAARSLKTQETKMIGAFFIPDYGGDFFGKLAQGIHEALETTDYELIVCNWKQLHRFLPEQVVDGAIVLNTEITDEDLLRYADLGHKIVVLDRVLNHPNINQVLLDNRAGATLAIDFLLENGHKKIYVVKGPANQYDAKQRLAAVREAIDHYRQMHTIDYQEIDGDFTRGSGERAANIITQEYSGPCGVFCLNDTMAIGMYDYLSTTNFQIGKDIHIIGFDHIELSRYINPKLTTIDFSKYKWGTIAAQNLLKLISGVPVENETIYVTLTKGDSVQLVGN